MPETADGVLRLDGFFLKESTSPRAALDSITEKDPLLYEVGRRADKNGRVTVNGHTNWIIELVRYQAEQEVDGSKVHTAKFIPFAEYNSLGRPNELA